MRLPHHRNYVCILFKAHFHTHAHTHTHTHTSSGDEGCSPDSHPHKTSARQNLSSEEDEFEKEMAGEALTAMKQMVSQATSSSMSKSTPAGLLASKGNRKCFLMKYFYTRHF